MNITKNKEGLFDIFIVEDNNDDIFLIRLALNEYFSNSNFLTANNGKTAIKIFDELITQNKKLPDLILLDINIPVINGIDVLKEIKSKDISKSIPTVIFTSSDSTSDMNYCYENGADLYIRKPNNINDFKKIIGYIKEYFLL